MQTRNISGTADTGTARVAVIIPNYNGAKLLPVCLDSLEGQSFRDFETVVVDNGSIDDSDGLLRDRYPWATVIGLPRNLGFAAAVNAGISGTESEFVALLNNDAEADPGWLATLVAALDRRPDISFCASKMLDFTDRSLIDSAGNCYAFNGRSLPRGFMAADSGHYDSEEEVFGACAGAALYRRSLFEEIGLFDKRFVSYKEDVDLDFRAQLAGRRCLYVPAAVCYHIGGATTGRRKSGPAVRLSARNSIITFVKNMPAALLPRALPLLLLDTFLQLGYQAVRGRSLVPCARGLLSAIPQLPYALRSRRPIQSRTRVNKNYLRVLFQKGDAEVKACRKRCRQRGER